MKIPLKNYKITEYRTGTESAENGPELALHIQVQPPTVYFEADVDLPEIENADKFFKECIGVHIVTLGKQQATAGIQHMETAYSKDDGFVVHIKGKTPVWMPPD